MSDEQRHWVGAQEAAALLAENTASFRQIVVPASRGRGDDLAKHVSDLVAFRPHIVLDMANGDTAAPAVEGAWPAGDTHRQGSRAPSDQRLAWTEATGPRTPRTSSPQ